MYLYSFLTSLVPLVALCFGLCIVLFTTIHDSTLNVLYFMYHLWLVLGYNMYLFESLLQRSSFHKLLIREFTFL